MDQETPENIQSNLDKVDVSRLTDEQLAKLEALKQKLIYVPIDEICPSKNKARRNLHAVPVVAASIRQFGFRNPIFVDAKDNTIVEGHTRWYAAKKLGLSKVPIVAIDDLSDEMLRLLRLADNKVGEIADWDFGELNSELESLSIDLPDLDFSDFGFVKQAEIDFEKDDESIDDYEEPKERNICCPKCGYIAGVKFFKKSE